MTPHAVTEKTQNVALVNVASQEETSIAGFRDNRVPDVKMAIGPVV